jgi:D-glycero-alpha-D-manno-heptose-7-phosphate kinase
MVGLVAEAESVLISKEDRLEEFGRLLDEQWKIKREMSTRVSTGEIDAMYETARGAGALGGKLLGAGGGGFLLLFVRPQQQLRVTDALSKLLFVPTRFDHLGSQIIYYSHEDQHLGQL